MLNHPTLDRSTNSAWTAWPRGSRRWQIPRAVRLDHPEWLGLMVEQEATLRQQRRFEARAKRQAATAATSRT